MFGSLAIDPTSSQTVYVGTLDGGVFKSTNGGASWSAITSGLTSMAIRSLAIDPTSSQTVYVGTDAGLFKTTTGGVFWSEVSSGLTSMVVQSLAIDTSSSQTVYAGTTGGVFRSTNGGASWSAVTSGLTNPYVQSLAIDPSNSRTVYAGTNGGVFKITFSAELTVTGLTISSGPASINEGGSATYGATATWSDGSTTTVTPVWSVTPTTYAGIGTGGLLTTLAVPSNQTVTITAGYTAGGITKTANKIVTINNVLFTMTLNLAGTGAGSVNSIPSGIACISGTCSAQFDKDSKPKLTEAAGADSTFGGWSGGGCSGAAADCIVTMSTNQTVNANFTLAHAVRLLSSTPADYDFLQTAFTAATGNVTKRHLFTHCQSPHP